MRFSRVEQRLGPGRIGLAAPEFDTLMEPKWTLTPELDDHGRDSQSGPEGGSGYRAEPVLGGLAYHRLLERPSALQRRGLPTGPRTDLSEPGPGGIVGIGFRVVDPVDGAANADLSGQRFPVKRQGRFLIGQKLLPFLAFKIRVKDEAALIESLE